MPPVLEPATRPTMYFIGVTTAKSSIHAVFPRWAERLGLAEARLVGVDFPLRDRPEHYRAAIDFIRTDPWSRGALVTTHKVDVFGACRAQFDELDPLTRSLGEIASIYKRGGRLHGRAVDPFTSGLALDAVLDAEGGTWESGAEALILGAGGAGTALAWQLGQRTGRGRPARLRVVDRDAQRLEHVERLHRGWVGAPPLEVRGVQSAVEADAWVAALPPGSLVVNATGMGKDAPGSPLTDAVSFPEAGIAWDLNYRGDLRFLAQARAQAARRGLCVADGWRYFLYGWTQVIADVFAVEIPPRRALFEELGRMAEGVR